jgi:mannose-6-phosphate isomerase-like protein (cupin superfamily)
MRRHRALVPLSHDHHRALVAARRLRRGAGGPDAAMAGAAFLDFFEEHTVPHFREEEELLFPLVVVFEDAEPLVVRALLEHQRLHALAAQLRRGGSKSIEVMEELADLLAAHVRFEERNLFPLIERLTAGDIEVGLASREDPAFGAAVHGPAWGAASDDLNATLLVWGPGEGPPEHVNEERDVLLVVVAGSVTVEVDVETSEVGLGEALIIAKGRRRKVTAGPNGVRYVSVHRRRPPLQVRPGSA